MITNPSSDQAKLRFALPADELVSLEIFSLDGRFLYKRSINGLKGINEVTLDNGEIGAEGSSISIVRITGNAINLQTKMLTLR